MELHEIRYFLAVARTLNFTRAAELCNVSQPALTRGIQKLEAELGGMLVARERQNTHLTELGRMMLPHFREVVTRTEAARDNAQRFMRAEMAELAIGTLCSMGPRHFAGFLGDYLAAHAGIAVSLVDGVPEQLEDLLLSGTLDVAVMARPEGFDARFVTQPLYDEGFRIACARQHRFAGLPEVPLEELAEERYLSRINCEYQDVLAAAVRAAGGRLSVPLQAAREDWIQAMVAAGRGVCFLPEYAALIPGLVLVPMPEPEVTRRVCVVTVAGRAQSLPLQRFVAAALAYPWEGEV